MRSVYCALLTAAVLALSQASSAALVEGLYSATAPLAERTPEERLFAVEEALARVLVKVTGQRHVTSDPAFEALLADAERFVLQEGYTADGQLWVGFDGATLQEELQALGQPVWGDNRPATLVWLAVDRGNDGRDLIYAEDETGIAETLLDAAAARGLPILLPRPNEEDPEAPGFEEVWGGFEDRLRDTAKAYGAEAILVGRAIARDPESIFVRWRLLAGNAVEDWRGTVADGADGAADRYAQRFSVAGVGGGATVELAVAGLADFRAYASVLRFLRSLSLVSAVGVGRAERDTVFFDVTTRGESIRLRNEIALRGLLAPAPGSAGAQDLRYVYQP